MRIAIVTIFSAFNYGSFLQAYAMQEILKKMGHEVAVLDCNTESILHNLRKNIAFKKPISSIKRALIYQKAYQKDWAKLNISKEVTDYFDLALIGSDEVWNIHGSFEQWPQYFGNALNAGRIIAYAPSIGFCPPEELRNSERFVKGIRNFATICPRDNATRQICLEVNSHVTERVVDPTLLMIDQWNELLPERIKKGKYLVYYSYLDNSPMKDYILRFAKEHNLKVIIAGFDYKWGDEIRICSPLEFLTLLNYAEYVFTSTFHGTVFSTILQKKLVVRPSGQKVVDYLELMGLSDRIFRDGMPYDEFSSIAEKNIDYNTVKKIQQEKQIQSLDILKQAIKA